MLFGKDMQLALEHQNLARLHAEMPTSGDLKSGDFSFITPLHRTTAPPQEKSDDPSPHQINLHTFNVHLNLAMGKKEDDFQSLTGVC